jgi:hypothetical protein
MKVYKLYIHDHAQRSKKLSNIFPIHVYLQCEPRVFPENRTFQVLKPA